MKGAPRGVQATHTLNAVALPKGEERYVLLFDDDHYGEALRTLGRWAGDKELSFSWWDAAYLCIRIRNLVREEA